MSQAFSTQLTNPFSSSNSRYQETSTIATVNRSEATNGQIASENQGKGCANPPTAHPGGTEDVMGEIVPERLRWLQLSKEDNRTRLVFHPSDPDAFHLEHVGLGINDQSYTDSCSQWLEFVCGDGEESVEISKVMAVAQSIFHVACKVSIHCKGSTQVNFEIYYDPETDQVTLINGQSSPTLVLKKESGPDNIIVYKGTSAELEPGAWNLTAPDVSRTTTLLVLPRRFLPARDDAEEFEPESRKRSASATLPAKRAKASSTVALVPKHTVPVADFEMRQLEHPLVSLRPGQTLKLVGSHPQEEYSITYAQKLAENKSSLVRKVQLSFPGHGNVDMVAKTVRKGMRDAKAAARVWQSETRIHSKLMATTAGARFIVQLLGTDARIHTIYMEDVEGPSLAHPTWRQRPENLFTGSRGVAGRIMRDIALALDYVHSKGITHYDVKPGNILYNDTRGAVLIDFGLSSDSPDTATNVYAAGTPWYIPPEFLAASNPGRGFPGDVWALGVVQLFLFKLLPLPETTAEWIISHVVGPKGPNRDRARETMVQWLKRVKNARGLLAPEGPGSDPDTLLHAAGGRKGKAHRDGQCDAVRGDGDGRDHDGMDKLVHEMTESDCRKRITMRDIIGGLRPAARYVSDVALHDPPTTPS